MTAEKPSQSYIGPTEETLTTRQAINRCISCHWADPAGAREISTSDITRCTNALNSGEHLRSLRKSGIAVATTVENGAARQLRYLPADTDEARAFVAALPTGPCLAGLPSPHVPKDFALPPAVRGATPPEDLAKANEAAEIFLLERAPATASRRRSERQRLLLGCMACHLSREPNAHVTARQIANCTGSSIEASVRFLTVQQRARLLTGNNPMLPRTQQQFRLTRTPEAAEYAELLTAPDVCAYELGKQLHEDNQAPPIASLPQPLDEAIDTIQNQTTETF